MASLVKAQAVYNERLTNELDKLRSEVDALSQLAVGDSPQGGLDRELTPEMKALSGPGVRVTLKDAPLSVKPAGVAEDLLVVHHRNIRLSPTPCGGGAEAVTIQGQRLNSTTESSVSATRLSRGRATRLPT